MSVEQQQQRGEAYAQFGDFRKGFDRLNLTTKKETPQYHTVRQLAELCWQRREELLSDNTQERRSIRMSITSEALQFLKAQEPPEAISGEADIIAEHLIDLATYKACDYKPQLSEKDNQIMDQALQRRAVRSETLKSLGREDIIEVSKKAELVLTLMISQLTSPPPSPPAPGMTL